MELEMLRREIPARLREAIGENYRGVVLYGSRARGDATEESDVDLLVLVDDRADLNLELDRIVRALYPLQLELEVPLHALPAREGSYAAGTYGLYRHAREEGILL